MDSFDMQLKRKALMGGAAFAAATATILVSTMAPASADPTRPYAATGSDTIQDVWNGLSNDFGAPIPSIASYNAFVNLPPGVAASTATSYIQTKSGGAWFARPSGSGNGVKSLSSVWDPAHSHLYPSGTGVLLNHEDVDFARSSGGPTAGTGLKYLPFARDAVSVAFNPYSTLTSLDLTTSQITELYTGNDNPADSVVTFSAQPSTASTVVSINGVVVHPQIPQTGSGTRNFFQSASASGTLAPYIADPATLALGAKPENDGTAIPNDGDLIPFSAAQWIAQVNGKATNTTAGLAMASISGLTPFTGTTTLTPGTLFGAKNGFGDYTTAPVAGVGTFNRDTYDVVPAAFLGGSATSKQGALVTLLGTGGVGGSSAKTIIKAFGFGTLQYVGNSSNFLDGAYQH